jgi:hypothetical protein
MTIQKLEEVSAKFSFLYFLMSSIFFPEKMGRADTENINRKPSVKIGDLIDSFNICKNRA